MRPAFSRDERGATVAEYVVIVGVIALGLAGAFKAFGSSVFGASGAQGETVTCVAMGDSTACAQGAGGGFPAPPGGGSPGGGSPGANPGPLASGSDCPNGFCVPGSNNCFVAGTPVATPSGLVPIERIHAGDEVLTLEPRTGEVRVGHAGATFVTPDRDIVDVRLRASGAPLRATPEHPFLTRDRGWVLARDLEPGEPLVSADGAAIPVEALSAEASHEVVFNFEVEETHVYFVGDERIAVHNVCTDPASTPRTPPPVPPKENKPASAVLDNQTTHAAKFPTVVDAQSLEQHVAQIFKDRGYGPPTVLKNDLPALDGQTMFVSQRVYGQLPDGVAESIVANGSVASEYRNNGITSTGDAQAQFAQDWTGKSVGDVAKDVASHKGPGAASSKGTKWVGVTTDFNYVYNGFDASKTGSKGENTGLVLVVTQGPNDKVLQTASMQAYMPVNKWTKQPTKVFGVTTTVNPDGTKTYTDNESEHLFAGAIPPESIVYAASAKPANSR